MILFLWSCQGGQIEPALSDRQHYLKALKEPSAQSARSCELIKQEDLRGECVLFAAKSAVGERADALSVCESAPSLQRKQACFFEVAERADALSVCESAPSLQWKQACFFEVADATGMTGHKAARICAATGDFEIRCLYHALQREEQSLAARFPKGKERELIEEIAERFENKVELDGDKISRSLPAKIVAIRFFQSYEDSKTLLFSEEACGTAPQDVCVQAYRFVIQMQKDREKKELPQPCTIPISDQQVKAAGFIVWEPSFALSGLDAWQNICRQSQSQKR